MNAKTMPRRSKNAEPKEPTVSITVRIPVTLHRRGLIVADAEFRSLQSVVLQALSDYVAAREAKEDQPEGGK